MNIQEKVLLTKKLFLGKTKDEKGRFSYFSQGFINDILIPSEINLKFSHNFSFEGDTAILTIVNFEKPEDKNERIIITKPIGKANLPNCHDAQNQGAAETYARRYLLLAAFDIAESDSLENEKPTEENEKTPKQNQPAQPQRPPSQKPNPQRPNFEVNIPAKLWGAFSSYKGARYAKS
jgi:hypothetical protein